MTGEGRGLRIVWAKTGPLHPLDTGGKIRTCNMLKALRKRHAVHYAGLLPAGIDPGALEQAEEYSQKQTWIPWREAKKGRAEFYGEVAWNAAFSRAPYVIAKYRSRGMAEAIARLAPDADVIVSDFLTPAADVLAGSRGSGRKTLLFEHNVEAQIWKRMYENAKGGAERLYLRGQWKRMVRMEKELAGEFGGVVAVSEEDAGILRGSFGLKNVLGSVPTGVDTDYFGAVERKLKRHAMVFLGSMDWIPNIDAMEWFVPEIYPLIKRLYPDATLTIAGRNPTRSVRALGEGDRSIHVTGSVPDVRPFLAEAEVMIVPLRIGGGTRVKIFEGMAAGIPVVSTGIGAEGLPVGNGKEIVLGDGAEGFAEGVGKLFQDAGAGEAMGAAGQRLVRERYSWEAAAEAFEGYCRQVAGMGD